MKTVPSQVDQKEATEPLILVQIDWSEESGGTDWYADKDVTIDTIDFSGRILTFSSISNERTQDSIGEIGNASITLDDSEGILKTKIKQEEIEGSSVTIYQYFDGNT